jgi:protein O-mannosyl-transferase
MPVAAAKPAIVLEKTEGIFRSPTQQKLVLGLLLVVATLALYNPVARSNFLSYDDDRYVTDNAQVRAGLHWSTVKWAFSSLGQANWHPVTWLSHALDCQLFQLNPVGHHYTSVLLHASNALLLFLILQWFTGYTARSLIVAALFAVHPLNVESVAWVAERKNVLCMFFLLLSVATYGWYVRGPGSRRYLLVALLFALSLMAKPMAITLPFGLLLLDYWPLGRFATARAVNRSEWATVGWPWWKLCLEKVPLLALSAGSAILTMIAQRAGGAVLTSAARNPLLRFENVAVSYVGYIEKAIWPARLAVLYPYPHHLPPWQVLVSAAILLGLSALVVRYRERRYLVFGWFWYRGTMVPMIGVIQVGNQAMADRYAYLPLIGLFVMMVWGATDFAEASGLLASSAGGKYFAGAAAFAMLLALSIVTHVQLTYWHDDYALWSRALAVTQNNFVAENNFANALTRLGRPDEAITHFRAAAEIEPLDPASELNLGIYAQEHGDMQQAVARYEYALLLATDREIRASAYANLGTAYFALRHFERSQKNFEAAEKLNRVYPSALLDMGLMAQWVAEKGGSGKQPDGSNNQGDWSRAASYYARFVSVAPSDVGYLLLANALEHAGRGAEAKWAYQGAVQVTTDIGEAQRTVAKIAAH